MKWNRLYFLIVFPVLLSCADSTGEYDLDSEVATAGLEQAGDVAPVTRQLNSTASSAPASEQKIIQNGNLEFETSDVETTHARILALVESFNGYVQNDNSGKHSTRVFRYMNVRIPSADFSDFVDSVSVGVGYFDRKEISRRDVTEEFIDLEARLKTKRELESRYLELLGQARNVKEVLEVERELAKIREEIESRQGRLEYLKSQVDMSAINISFYKVVVDSGITVSYGRKMINAVKGGWNGISVFFIGLIYLWPLFVLLTIGLLILRSYLKRKKRTSTKTS